MGKMPTSITNEQAELIRKSHLFFVASVDPGLGEGPDGIGPVNLSPKGATPLHVLSPNRVAYLDLGGSGNETARHADLDGPITVMVCSFEDDQAAIVRLYGRARTASLEDLELVEIVRKGARPSMRERQVIVVDVECTQTSCGYSVPVMEFKRERRKEGRGRKYRP